MQAPARTSPASFIKHAADVAYFYGFLPAREVERLARRRGAELERVRAHSFASVCAAASVGGPEPALAWWAASSPAHVPAASRDGAKELGEFGLHIGGTQESVGEIVLLKTISTIINEWGASVARVRLNALGDRDSKLRYARELSYYFRKHASSLCESCRAKAATDPFAPFSCPQEVCHTLAESAPRAMNFLSEKSRAHFREVLEHVEGLGLPYELDDLLVEDPRESQMLFSFDLAEPDATIEAAMGGRFDDHVRKLTSKKEGWGVSASVLFRKKGLSAASFTSPVPARPPKVFFIQLGLRAKMAGLSVIDELRTAQVPVMQSFDAAKLTPQLDAAKAAGVSHLIIMGAREALDGTVIVRALGNSSQTIIELRQLPRFLKTLR